MPVNAVALGTLAAKTAISLNSVMANITHPFLMLEARYILQLTGRTINDDGPIAVLLANGDASIGEVATGMQEQNTAGPSDISQMLTQDNAGVIYQSTVKAFIPRGDGTEGILDTGWFRIGGRKGIPAMEDAGWTLHAFNCGNGALTTGSVVNGQAWVRGVWLND